MSGCRWRTYLAIGGLAFFLAVPALAQQEDQAEAQPTPPPAPEEAEPDRQARWITTIEIAALIVTVGVASWAALAASKAAMATNEANKITRETAEHQLRAYVSINEASITPGPTETSGPTIRINFVNSGQTPANDLVGLLTTGLPYSIPVLVGLKLGCTVYWT